MVDKGKYSRSKDKGLSKLQFKILQVLDKSAFKNHDKPMTLKEIVFEVTNNLEITSSAMVTYTKSLERLRKRGLIKNVGRNILREYLWEKIYEN